LAWLLLAVMLLSVLGQITTVKAETGADGHVLTLSAKKISIMAGCRGQLYVTSGYYALKMYSTDKDVVTISKNGLLKAKKAGKATIVAKDTYSGAKATCKVTVKKRLTAKQIRSKIYGLKSRYPEGKPWTNGNLDKYGNGGCYAFMMIAVERVFGKATLTKQHKSFNKIRVGDHIRIGNFHSVVVLKKKRNSVVVVEGNYNSSIHWGREITRRELREYGFYVDTRIWT